LAVNNVGAAEISLAGGPDAAKVRRSFHPFPFSIVKDFTAAGSTDSYGITGGVPDGTLAISFAAGYQYKVTQAFIELKP
jgi:hypothetical protein